MGYLRNNINKSFEATFEGQNLDFSWGRTPPEMTINRPYLELYYDSRKSVEAKHINVKKYSETFFEIN